MYIAKKTGYFAAKDQSRQFYLEEGKKIPDGVDSATLERMLKKAVVEKVSSKEDAPENKAAPAPASKGGKGKKGAEDSAE